MEDKEDIHYYLVRLNKSTFEGIRTIAEEEKNYNKKISINKIIERILKEHVSEYLRNLSTKSTINNPELTSKDLADNNHIGRVLRKRNIDKAIEQKKSLTKEQLNNLTIEQILDML